MARVPQSEIDRLKSEISLEQLVRARGIELKPHGQDLIGHCVWHDDRTPSLVISPSKNLWHCLGACQTGGSVIDWVMKIEGVSFKHAVELLRSGEILTGPARPTKVSTVPKLPCPVDLSADDYKLLDQVVTYYTFCLKSSPEALAYLKARGLTDSELIDRFRLGFGNRTLGLRLPDKNRKAGHEIRSRLQALGILRESGHEHFNGSLVIPILDRDGRIQGIYGRKITPGLRPGTPDHLYLPGPHRGVFNIHAVAAYREVILCEALIDALTFLDAGFPNVIASYGVEGFTPHHLEAFRRYGTRRVLIAYDRDEAGDRAAEKLAATLAAEGIEVFRIQFPRGMDANAYALSTKPATKALELVIRSAVWVEKGPKPERPHRVLMTEEESRAHDAREDARARTEPAAPAAPPAALPPTPQIPPAERLSEASLSLAADSLESALPPAPPPPQPPAPPPPASPVPPPPAPGPKPTREGADVVLVLGDRHYRVRGLEKNQGPELLKVNVMVTRGELFHVDTINLYFAPQRDRFLRDATREVDLKDEVLRRDLGHLLRGLEDLQRDAMKQALTPKKAEVVVSPKEEAEALELLEDPNLLDRILTDFETCGVVGEEINKLVGYLAAISRRLDHPLAVVIQSSSAAGKSALMEAILAFVPEEDRVKYSAMTGQSLFYMSDCDLKHKVLAIVEEEGAERASYALKLLQSEGELSIASTGKDPTSGRHITHEYRVEGPVMIFLTTTAVEIDEELLNRCLVLTVNEDREQTKKIHRMQREMQTLEGMRRRHEAKHVLRKHRNAQRLLRPLMVINPHAHRLTFRDDQTRTRRDHGKYLMMIQTIALLHQRQKPISTAVLGGRTVEYITVTPDDVRKANQLAHEVLGRTLDELPPHTRRLLHQVEGWVVRECERLQTTREHFRFMRRDLRPVTSLSFTQLRGHLDRLVAFEYLIAHRGGRGQSFVYELLYNGEGKEGQPFVMGLLDPDELEKNPGYDGKLAGSGEELAGSWRAHGGAKTGGWRGATKGLDPASNQTFEDPTTKNAENMVPRTLPSSTGEGASYPELPTREGRDHRGHNGTRRTP
jgi:DNA primase catalytic core